MHVINELADPRERGAWGEDPGSRIRRIDVGIHAPKCVASRPSIHLSKPEQ